MERRVVVTGMGALCSHGKNPSSIFNNIATGMNAIRPISRETHFDASQYPQTAGKHMAAVDMTDASLMEYIDPDDRKLNRLDRHQLFALIAASHAYTSAKLQNETIDKSRFGIVGGTGDGGLKTGFESDQLLLQGKKLRPYANLGELPNIFVGYIANRFGLKGPSAVHVTACAASAHAIMQAADEIKLGYADIMLAGGTEAAGTPFGIASFSAQGALGSDSRPYQTGRDGFVMGEGAAFLVLESLEHATGRGASILAELKGYGKSTDGSDSGAITAPDMMGGYRSAKMAIDMANVLPEQIDYINTHGTGTGADPIELEGIKLWAEGFAPDIPVSSTKSWHGHLLGAAGALEAVLSIITIREGVLLPTRGLTEKNLDPSCTGVDHVMGGPRKKRVEHVLSNSFGFGGTNATLIFSAY